MKTAILFPCLFLSIFAFSQSVNYNDVAVIVNDNSPVSLEIGDYFQEARNIPEANIIHVFAPTTEQINETEFQQMRGQVEFFLVENDLVDSINYLVTTKGVPLAINGGCIQDTIPGAACASVDAELSLILGGYSNSIGASGSIPNPLFEATDHFSHDVFDFYLVTRLDGYTKEDVFNMIDRSGPMTGINKQTAQAFVDISNGTGTDSSYFVQQYQPAYEYLDDNLWNVTFDSEFAPVANQENVFGYFGLGHGPLPVFSMNYEWTEGAVGSMSMCNSANTFNAEANTSNSFYVADLIADGCTGAIGSVEYIYFGQIMRADVFVDRYYHPTENYNLAESFYMSELQLSWQTVVIGDPKASVVIDNVAGIDKVDATQLNVYPNPSSGFVTVNSDVNVSSLVIYDMKGMLMERHDGGNGEITMNLEALSSGVYLMVAKTDLGVVQKRITISK